MANVSAEMCARWSTSGTAKGSPIKRGVRKEPAKPRVEGGSHAWSLAIAYLAFATLVRPAVVAPDNASGGQTRQMFEQLPKVLGQVREAVLICVP